MSISADNMPMFTTRSGIVAVIIVTGSLWAVLAAQGPPKVWTQQEMLARNVGTREDQRSPFPPHRIVGNVYYVEAVFRSVLAEQRRVGAR